MLVGQSNHSEIYKPRMNSSKRRLNSILSNITLASVLSGDTCEPITLSDFEGYLTYKEHSLESLQFVVWYQDYRRRFFELPEEEQALSPGPSEFKFTVPSRESLERRADESFARQAHLRVQRNQLQQLTFSSASTDSHSANSESLAAFGPSASQPVPRTTGIPSFGMVSTSEQVSTLSGVTEVKSSPCYLPQNGSGLPLHLPRFEAIEKQPFRQECLRIMNTFLKPGAIKELPIDGLLRDTVIRDLAHNTHPDIFKPAYEEIYNLLETVSLPRFLALASTLINFPRRVLWYAFGVISLSIALIIALTLIFSMSTPPEAKRAYRLFSLPFVWVGSLQIYSAWRGFCAIIWKRGNTQLRVWELQDIESDAKLRTSRALSDPEWTEPPFPLLAFSSENKLGLIEMDSKPGRFVTSFDSLGRCTTNTIRSKSCDLDFPPVPPLYPETSRNGLLRTAILGPERVVLDPRIKAVHAQVMSEINRFGLYFVLVGNRFLVSCSTDSSSWRSTDSSRFADLRGSCVFGTWP